MARKTTIVAAAIQVHAVTWPVRVSVFLAFAYFLVCVQSSYAQNLGEKSSVVDEVLSLTTWVSEADRCPAELAQSEEANDRTSSKDCRVGNLKSCLIRCKAGVPGACYWLGQTLQSEGKARQAAEVLFQRSCKLGVASGCTNRAAGMALEKKNNEVTQACAAKTYQKTCALDDPWGCTMYAFHLSKGLGTTTNRELALQVLKKSCKYGPEDDACSQGLSLRKQLLKEKQVAQ